MDPKEIEEMFEWFQALRLVPPSKVKFKGAEHPNCIKEFAEFMEKEQMMFHKFETLPDRDQLLALRRRCYDFQQNTDSLSKPEQVVLNELMERIESLKGVRGGFIPLLTNQSIRPRKP